LKELEIRSARKNVLGNKEIVEDLTVIVRLGHIWMRGLEEKLQRIILQNVMKRFGGIRER
jgi:hypothetical protein